MRIERVGKKDYEVIGYKITDKNWPCGDLYDISGQDFEGEFNRENIEYLLRSPKDYELCQDRNKLEKWLENNYENVIWRVYPDGDFYVTSVLRDLKNEI